MPCFENIAVVIPSYNPDQKLVAVVEGLASLGFCAIIVVDDGSRSDCQPFLESVATLPGCTLLRHDVNRGKGQALKTAFAHILAHLPECIGAVTADGDGQHHPEDVAAVAHALQNTPDALILGVRDFSQPDVPLRSRLGNRATALIFRLACRQKLTDTQTGLRAIPRVCLPDLVTLAGNRFEYETNMLLSVSQAGYVIRETVIKTIYIEKNETSHFRAVADSLSILRQIFAFAFSSVCCAMLDFFGYWLAVSTLVALPLRDRVLVATLISRAVSSAVNYLLNRHAVFGSHNPHRRTLVRYYLLCVCQFVCSWAGVWGLTLIIGGSSVLAKVIVDSLLFFISFHIQRLWVFASPHKDVQS